VVDGGISVIADKVSGLSAEALIALELGAEASFAARRSGRSDANVVSFQLGGRHEVDCRDRRVFRVRW